MIKVLYVEDDDLDRFVIRRAFKSEDIELVFAENFEGGKNLTDGIEYDCIFLDYSLPDGSGIELLKHIRAKGNNSPVVIVTSHGDETLAVDAMKNGAQDYIPKDLLTHEGLKQSLRYALQMKANEKERKRIENELHQAQERLQTVVSNSPIMLFCVDETGKYIFFEGKGVTKYGLNGKDFIGKTFEDMAPHLPGLRKDFEEALKGADKTVVYESRNRFFEVFWTPMRDNENKITGVIGLGSDITDHKTVEKELLRAKNLAEEASQMKQQFLANMSHEIRTPMNGIVGLTDILLDTKMDEEQHNYLKSIKKCSDNLQVIINDILDLSKIEAGKMSFEEIVFCPEDVVKHTFDLFIMRAKEKNISLQYDLEKDICRAVTGDPTRLGQILNNLVSNAVKFTDKGGISISVRRLTESELTGNSSLNAEDCHLHFEVTDTGIGIKPESLSAIFESFTQASSDTTRKFGGTGLGLTIIKKLVELQGGVVGVNSTPGVGSTFYFNLSFKKVNSNAAQAGNEIPSSTRSIPDSSNLGDIKILIVEDNAVNQMVVKKLFATWGVEIEVADNGAIAIEKLVKGNFDVVLMDIQMPVMDGYTATNKIRNELPEPFCKVPIIAMTASVPTEKDKCMAEGMNDFIIKPFNPHVLKEKIIEHTKGGKPVVEKKKVESPVAKVAAANSVSQHSDVKIDLHYLKEVSNNNTEFILQMIELFLQKTPIALEEMNEKFKQQNWEDLRTIAHKIKPTYTYVGLGEVHKLLAEIEDYSQTRTNLEKLPNLIEQVESRSKEAFRALEKEMLQLK